MLIPSSKFYCNDLPAKTKQKFADFLAIQAPKYFTAAILNITKQNESFFEDAFC